MVAARLNDRPLQVHFRMWREFMMREMRERAVIMVGLRVQDMERLATRSEMAGYWLDPDAVPVEAIGAACLRWWHLELMRVCWSEWARRVLERVRARDGPDGMLTRLLTERVEGAGSGREEYSLDDMTPSWRGRVLAQRDERREAIQYWQTDWGRRTGDQRTNWLAVVVAPRGVRGDRHGAGPRQEK